MKKLLYLPGLLLLITQLIHAQQHDQVTSILTEYYQIPIPNVSELDHLFYHGKKMETFEYDERHNLTFHNDISYDSLGEITEWNGVEFSHNENDQLQEQEAKRYNWEVDLWIVQGWTNYNYNLEGCNDEITQQPNTQQSIPVKWVYTNNEACQPVTGQLIYDLNRDGVFDLGTELKYDLIYDYHENGERSYHYWKYYIYSSIDLTLVPSLEAYVFYNSYGDITERTVYDLYDGMEIYSKRIVNFEFSFDEKGRLINKKEFREDFFGGGTPNLQYRAFNYGYSCDGLLLNEEELVYRNDLFQNPTKIIRKHFTYKDKYPCVDYYDYLKPKITPNPASQIVEIRMPIFQGLETDIRVYALSGQLIKQAMVPANQIRYPLNIADFPNGIYVVFVKSGDRFSNEKLIVAN